MRKVNNKSIPLVTPDQIHALVSVTTLSYKKLWQYFMLVLLLCHSLIYVTCKLDS